ncbi:protein kinase domain-containing protein [Archangium sp.]|uniref:protein kinase domain-containing protein n=1 Tax=Archangium sp. TaxID=1872627 RepID=UPI00286AFDA8|nr:protein kinase [Archangium sp.]
MFPSLPVPPQPGERLGGGDGRRYEIIGRLGKGGMGLVVRAHDELLQRTVALKFISPGREFSEESLKKLLQEEARLVAQLNHENIVQIFDVSEWKGSPFLIMECLAGQSLEALLRHGPLELPQALRLLSDITAGLAHAHAHQIIHRDLKPGNVFILKSGRAKLLDFGLARVSSSLELPRAGTFAYMAPEQWRGQPQDLRTDIWAAGLLLYRMLAGMLPYDTEDLQALRERMLSGEPVPPLRTCRPDLPEQVDRFLARALAKAPARRFQSALEMRERLRVLEWTLAPSAGLSPPRFIPHRRQLSLVCCRLSGDLASFDPEDVSELQAAFQQACARIIEEREGWVHQRLSDEVLGCFGYPLAREDDVLRAVRAALALTEVTKKLPQREQARLAVHVGVHTAMVVVTPSLQGEAPRVAMWLARQAPPDTVYLSEETRQGAWGNFVTEALGRQDFVSSVGTLPLSVHRVLGERQENTRFGRALTRGRTPLVARTEELRQLIDRWEDARGGQGAMVLLTGEAGIGKSRLIQELCEHVAREGQFCVSSQCWPQLNRSAFHPVLEWLVHLLGWEPESSPARRWAQLEEVLSALDLPLPESLVLLGQLLGLPPREELPPLPLSSEQQRERTLETLAAFFVRLPARLPAKAGSGSLLLVLEDLHWADPSTLQLLDLLRERIELSGVCLLLSTRPEPKLPWRRLPGVHRLVLERLTAEDTEAMVRRLTPEQSVLSGETLQALVRQTEGIPLFVEEMTRMVLNQSGSQGGSPSVGALPVTLQELLLARLDPLPEEQKELAWTGAVIGRSFTRAQLAALSEGEGTTLDRNLAELVDEGVLLCKCDDPEPRYEFKHALVQEAAYESLLKPRRRQYHHRFAVLLEHPASGAATAPPELVAHHYTQAGELEPALRFWAQAGELALRRSAFEESVAHLRQALGLFRRLPRAARRVDEELRLLVLLGQALVATRSYSAPEVEQVYARIPQLFQDVRNIPVLLAACGSLFVKNMMRLDFTLAFTLSEQLGSLGQRAGIPQLQVVGRLMGGMSQLLKGEVVEAQASFHEAVAQGDLEAELEPQALSLLETEPLAMALAFQAVCCIIRCEQQEGLRLIELAVRRAEALGHPYTSLLVHEAASLLHWIRFDVRRMLEAADKALVIFNQGLFPTFEGWAPALRGWALLVLGRQEEGYSLLLEDLERMRQARAEVGWTFFYCLLAHARLRMGLRSEGLAAVSEGLAWGERAGEHLEDAELRRVRGELLLRNGEGARALIDFQEAIQLARRSGARCIELRAVLSLCHLLQEQGRGREAQRLLRETLAPLPEGLDSPELRVARILLDRLQDEHAEQEELERILSDAPWEVRHIQHPASPPFLEPL